MKKIILSLIFTVLFSAAAFGYGRITLSECSNLSDGELLRNYIKIEPEDTVPTGAVVTIEYENAIVFSQNVIDGNGSPEDIGYKGVNNSYQYKGLKSEYKWNKNTAFVEAMSQTKTAQVPYSIKRISDSKVEVTLCGIPKEYAKSSLKYINGTDDIPYYYIPLTAYVSDGSKEVKATVKGPLNGFLRDSVIIVANKDKTASNSDNSYIFEEQSTESTTENSVNKVSVKIGSETMLVNDSKFTLDSVPYIQRASGSTMIPLRAVSIALASGYEGTGSLNIISWDGVTKTAIITYNGKRLEFTANTDYFVIDGEKIQSDNGVYSEITDNRMFVPFRAIGEAFDINVNWDSETKTASFN